MSVVILREKLVDNHDGTFSRHADIEISNGAATYEWGVGGLPATGNLQPVLEANAEQLFAAAATKAQAVSGPKWNVLKQAAAAKLVNDTFLNNNNPTTAQVRDHVRSLAQQNNAIVSALVHILKSM